MIAIPEYTSALPDVVEVIPSAAERELQELLQSALIGLPLLPEAASRAIELVENPKADIGRLSDLIRSDPPIAARFLSVANSALYSRGREVPSIQDALVRIGLSGSRDLLLQIVYACSSVGLTHFGPQVRRSYDRAVVSGIVARAACSELGIRYSDAYLIGLLHDLGEARIFRLLDRLDTPPSAVEAAILVERYHTEAGEDIARAWKLPQDVVDVCGGHHRSSLTQTLPVRLVRIADLLASAVIAEAQDQPSDDPLDLGQLALLGVSGEDAAAIIEHAVDLMSPNG